MRYRIAGYGGQHEEAGARIEDDAGSRIVTTPALESNTPEHWKAYHDRNAFILNALNGHEPMKAALRLAKGVMECEYPREQLAERGMTKIDAALVAAGEVL